MKKILYISYDGMTDALGQSQVLPYLTALSRLGYRISILSVEKKQNFAKSESIIRQITQAHQIEWSCIFYTKKPPVLSTLYDLRKLKKIAFQKHKTEKYDLIHCRSYISALIGLEFKRKKLSKFLFDMRGFWADERVDGNLWNLKNPVFRAVYQYFKRKEQEFLQEADYTISLTHNAKEEIEGWRLPKAASIQVIPCCVDTDFFDREKLKEIPQKSALVLSYLGSLGTWYMLEEMLLFFKKLLEVKPESRFLFITKDDPALVWAKADALDIDREKLRIQSAERAEVPHLLAQSDVSLFFIKPAFSKKASSATKMGEILALGIPVITNDGVGDHAFLFENYPCGYLLTLHENRADLEQEFQKALTQIDACLAIPPEKLRTIALDYFSLEEGVRRYQEVYEKIFRSAVGG